MAKGMNCIAVFSIVCTIGFVLVYGWMPADWLFSMAITCGTISYHFVMRLLVGYLYDHVMKNTADYTKGWYQIHSWEQRFYEQIKVKKWKGKMPAYQPELFSPRLHTWHEIAQAMCQAELVHETIVVLSFLPVFAAYYVGALEVFFITSTGAALFDCLFVIMQRYNRPRVVRMALREQKTR